MTSVVQGYTLFPSTIPDLTGLSVVMNNGVCGQPGDFGTGFTLFETRMPTRTHSTPPASIRLLVWGGYLSTAQGEQSDAALLTNAGKMIYALEGFNGSTVQFQFSGASQVWLMPGQLLLSDPLFPADFGLTKFPANTNAFVRCSSFFDPSARPYSYYAGLRPNSSSGEVSKAFNSTTLHVDGSGNISGGTNIRGPNFLGLLGTWDGPPLPSALFVGDSIPNGVGDTQDGFTFGGGFLVRACRAANGGNGIPFINFTRGSDQATISFQNTAIRELLAKVVTVIYEEYGNNDIAAGTAPAVIYAAKKAFMQRCRAANPSVLYRWVLVGPNTHSTDQWKTFAGQTPSSGWQPNGRADTLMASMIAEAASLNVVIIDARAPVAAAADQRIWDTDGTTIQLNVKDGKHPSPLGHQKKAVPVTADINSLSAATTGTTPPPSTFDSIITSATTVWSAGRKVVPTFGGTFADYAGGVCSKIYDQIGSNDATGQGSPTQGPGTINGINYVKPNGTDQYYSLATQIDLATADCEYWMAYAKRNVSPSNDPIGLGLSTGNCGIRYNGSANFDIRSTSEGPNDYNIRYAMVPGFNIIRIKRLAGKIYIDINGEQMGATYGVSLPGNFSFDQIGRSNTTVFGFPASAKYSFSQGL